MLDIRNNKVEKPLAVRFADDDHALNVIRVEEDVDSKTIAIIDNEGDVAGVVESREQLDNLVRALQYAQKEDWLEPQQ
jgi:hypothetical protein